MVYDDLIAGSAGGAYAYVEISLSAVTIQENSAGITVGNLIPNSESYTYSLSGDDAGSFVVSGVKLSLAESVTADYETQQSYSIIVTASDSLGNSTDQDFIITVVDVNESPSEVSLSATSVAEGEAGASIGTLSATDPDADDTLTFSLSGDDADSLEISGTTLKLLDSVTADYGTKSSYSITAIVTDSASNTAEAAFTISVTETPAVIVTSGGSSGGGGGGCFIATAAFGSYENRYVKSLRHFRDKHLLTNTWGEKFVNLYYKHSPPIAAKIETSELLKSSVRAAIYPMVGFTSMVEILGWSGVLTFLLVAIFGAYFYLIRPRKIVV